MKNLNESYGNIYHNLNTVSLIWVTYDSSGWPAWPFQQSTHFWHHGFRYIKCEDYQFCPDLVVPRKTPSRSPLPSPPQLSAAIQAAKRKLAQVCPTATPWSTCPNGLLRHYCFKVVCFLPGRKHTTLNIVGPTMFRQEIPRCEKGMPQRFFLSLTTTTP
jgi:hypothetical protein